MQHQRTAHTRADVTGARAHHDHALGAAAPAEQPRTVELAQRLAHRGAIDAELARELDLGRQVIAGLQPTGDDVIDQRAGDLAVGGLDRYGLELQVHAVIRNSSRPISMRRISCVPAPISYSLASRSSRPAG